jgi:hypothetical protein
MSDFMSVFWSASLPSNWAGQNDPECATFVGQKSVGALQISSTRKNGEVTDDDLRDFAAEHLENVAKTRPVTAGDFAGFMFSYGDEENYWRQWFLRHNSVAVFVTYNCSLKHMHQEDSSVDAIIASLRARV